MLKSNYAYEAPNLEIILISIGNIITTSGPDSGGGETETPGGGENSGEWDIDSSRVQNVRFEW